MAEVTKEQVVDYLSNLPVIQIAELVKELEGKWGVSAAPVAMAGGGGGAAAAAAPVEEKTEFDVILAEGGPNKIQRICHFCLKLMATTHSVVDSKDRFRGITSQASATRKAPAQAELRPTCAGLLHQPSLS